MHKKYGRNDITASRITILQIVFFIDG
jgi:hypothetical protein